VNYFTTPIAQRLATLRAMDTHSTPDVVTPPAAAQPLRIDDLSTLVLADGLPAERGGKTIRYRTVKLRETNVADERKAEQLSERAMLVNGSYKLLVSESNFKHVLNMLHIESFGCDQDTITQASIDLALYDKLSSRDLELLEQRIFLLTLAAEVRYGNMSEEEFNALAAGIAPKTLPAGPVSPQPQGQTATVGTPSVFAQPGPALITDYLGAAAQGQA
jgi:phage FluMu protein gp41